MVGIIGPDDVTPTCPPLPSMLSRNFSLREMTRTQLRLGNTPTPEAAAKLKELCETILEPMRWKFGPLHVNSGYRSREINHAIGGASDSAHLYGCAADVEPCDPSVTIEDLMMWLSGTNPLEMPFDQAISEQAHGAEWLHIALVRPGHGEPRRQLLSYRGWTYVPWRHV